MMPGVLIWGKNANETKQIATEDELEAAIAQLTNMAQADKPFTVSLRVNSETDLEMIVGLQISSLLFYSATDTPQYSGSIGSSNDDEWIAFLHQGEFSEKPKKYFIPIEEAQEAVREYFKTGKRPENIRWISAG